MALSLEDRKAVVRQNSRIFDLQDLRGSEVQRLLRLARDEGLLGAILRDIQIEDRPELAGRLLPLGNPAEPGTQPTRLPSSGPENLRTASVRGGCQPSSQQAALPS